MNNSLIDFFRKRIIPREIFEARLVSKKYIVLQTVIICLLLGFPLAVAIYRINFDSMVNILFPNFTNEVNIQNDILRLTTGENLAFGNEVLIKDNNSTDLILDNKNKYIILSEEHVHVSYEGVNLYGGYITNLNTTINGEYSSTSNFLATILYDIRLQILSILVILAYPITAVLNIIFISCISLTAISLNYKAQIKMNFKEFFTLLIYGATLPAFLALIFGTLISAAFIYVIYNFGVIGFSLYIYRKCQTSGNQYLFQ
jgi:hypothetical protein